MCIIRTLNLVSILLTRWAGLEFLRIGLVLLLLILGGPKLLYLELVLRRLRLRIWLGDEVTILRYWVRIVLYMRMMRGLFLDYTLMGCLIVLCLRR